MTILSWTFDVYENHIQSQHFIQKWLIAFEFRDLKWKMNEQFRNIKKVINGCLKTKNEQLKKINEWIKQIKQKMNDCFENVIHCFIQQERKI